MDKKHHYFLIKWNIPPKHAVKSKVLFARSNQVRSTVKPIICILIGKIHSNVIFNNLQNLSLYLIAHTYIEFAEKSFQPIPCAKQSSENKLYCGACNTTRVKI